MPRVFFLFVLLIVAIAGCFPVHVTHAATTVCTCIYDDVNGNEKAAILPAEVTEKEAVINDVDCLNACKAYYSDADTAALKGVAKITDGSVDPTTAARVAQDAYNTFEENGQCNCYCGKAEVGARPLDGTYQTEGECKTECETQDMTFVSCATSLDQSPLGNQLCFTSEECTTADGDWGKDQPPECESAYHYCYPVSDPITLSVPLGNITTVSDLGTFINAVYSYSLGIAAIIAVVMIMIGGVQYILGGANPELVKSATGRISNAIVGLVILLSAYLILRTVSPYLVDLKAIQLPMIKPAQFLAGSCENYIDKGYTVVPEEEDNVSCGDIGTIVADANGGTTTGTCTYNSCAETDSPNGRCSNVSGGFQCLTCDEVSAKAVSLGYQADAYSCPALDPLSNSPEGKLGYRCEFIQDVDFNDALWNNYKSAAVGGTLGSAVGCAPCSLGAVSYSAMEAASELYNSKVSGSCGLVKVDCSKITKCSDYDGIQVGKDNLASLDSLEDLFKDACENNWCAANVTDGPCGLDTDGNAGLIDGITGWFRYTAGVGWLDCESKKPTTTTSTSSSTSGSGSRPGRSE